MTDTAEPLQAALAVFRDDEKLTEGTCTVGPFDTLADVLERLMRGTEEHLARQLRLPCT